MMLTRRHQPDRSRAFTLSSTIFLLFAVLSGSISAQHTSIKALNAKADMLFSHGYYELAAQAATEALQAAKAKYGAASAKAAAEMNNLAYIYMAQGRYTEADTLYSGAVRIWQRNEQEHLPQLAVTLNNLGELYSVQERFAEAKKFYRKALALKKRIYFPDHPSLATTLNNLGELYERLGQPEKAIQHFEEALRILAKRSTDTDDRLKLLLLNLAELYERVGRSRDGLKARKFADQLRINR